MGFCHHCKQYKAMYILAACKYNSRAHGPMLPQNVEVNALSIPNVEAQRTELINHFIEDKFLFDKKKKKIHLE